MGLLEGLTHEGCYDIFFRKGSLLPDMLVLIGYPRVDNVSYELELSAQLKAVHLVFQITMLKMYMGNPSVIIPTENIGAKDNLFYEKMSV